MELLVVGTVAYDSVKTPFGERKGVLGGSAAFCAMAASYFTDVAIVADVGEDFADEDRRLLESHQIDLSALQTVNGAKSFHWQGEYGEDMNDARTIRTDLNVLMDFDPVVPEAFRSAPYLFLANIDPKAQLKVLDQLDSPRLVAADTMNFWIENSREDLMRVLPRIDVLVINEAEARQLSGEGNLFSAARSLLSCGPAMLVIKRGEYGVLKITADSIFAAPSFPLEKVFDPTGAGDSFAGGFMGYISSKRNQAPETMRRAAIMGSVMASYNVEDFSMNRLASLSREDIEARYNAFRRLTEFGDL